MEALQQKYADRVQFYLVYIREAHPTDGGLGATNAREKVLVAQPKTLAERAKVASAMCEQLKINLPTLIDGLDDAVNKAYAAWPDRLYLVAEDGTIAYKGGPGPRGLQPQELAQAIEVELAK